MSNVAAQENGGCRPPHGCARRERPLRQRPRRRPSSPTSRKPGPADRNRPEPRPKGAGGRRAQSEPQAHPDGAAAAMLALIGGGWFGFDYATAGRFMVSTDDAYVRANNTTLGAKVSGYISELLVEENTKVRAGDVIARIDDGDYRLAVDSARDKVATQAGDHRALRPADRRAACRGRAGAGPAGLGPGGTDADAARIRAPAGFRGQAIRQQADARTIDRQPRPGQCVGAEREGRARQRRRQYRRARRRRSRKP